MAKNKDFTQYSVWYNGHTGMYHLSFPDHHLAGSIIYSAKDLEELIDEIEILKSEQGDKELIIAHHVPLAYLEREKNEGKKPSLLRVLNDEELARLNTLNI